MLYVIAHIVNNVKLKLSLSSSLMMNEFLENIGVNMMRMFSILSFIFNFVDSRL